MAHCRKLYCLERFKRDERLCGCMCPRCVEADDAGLYVHGPVVVRRRAHPFAAPSPTTPATSDGWPPVAPVVQGDRV